MKSLFGASLTTILATAAAVPALAADLPEVKVSSDNQVPACATPGRMMELLRSRNPSASHRFDSIATEYMRIGEELGVRWDLAFFQMMLETGALSFTGDVRSDQNNFAGLGASGGGKRGERFPDIATGVKAHLQHLLMYAGEHIDDPVAERTRKVQEWGVLTEWQQSISGPMTFSLLSQQWAPGSRNYVRDIATINDEFYPQLCNGPDPQPELVQEARKGRLTETQIATNVPPAAPGPDTTKPTGTEVAQKAIEEERKENPPRSALGAGLLGNVAATAKAAAVAANKPPAQPETKPAAEVQPAVTVLNSTEQKVEPEAPKAKPQTDGATIQTASVAGAATQLDTPAKKADKCKVWTASYGGQRAIIIKASTDGTDNYTVLDVNETSQKREVDAYIAAYAKGGKQIGEFANQTKALDKAFELCPEG